MFRLPQVATARAAFSSTPVRGVTKAKQVLGKAAREQNIKKQVKKAQETAQRYHNRFFKEDGYANLRTDKAWQKRVVQREQAIFKAWETKFNWH